MADEIPDGLFSLIWDEVEQIHSEHSQNEVQMQQCVEDMWSGIKVVHGKEAYFRKLRKKVYNKMRNFKGRKDRRKKLTCDRGNKSRSVTSYTNSDAKKTSNSSLTKKIRAQNEIHKTVHEINVSESKQQWYMRSRRTAFMSCSSPRKSILQVQNSLNETIPSSSGLLIDSSRAIDHPDSSLIRRSNRATGSRKTVNSDALQITQCCFMEIPMPDPSQRLTMCMSCRMVPIQFRFPDSYIIGPTSINRIQAHHQKCQTSGLDLTTAANALDEVIRIEFGNDVDVIKLDSFVDVIRAAVVHDTLVTIFTRNIARLIRQQRELKHDDDGDNDDEDDIDPNVVPPNAWQLFPTNVEFDMMEEALHIFSNVIGKVPFRVDQDYPNFLHFLFMISPGLHATKRCNI
jgi:hypothetical protein